ncbi:cytosine permease [Nocardioides pyridinolyticus]
MDPQPASRRVRNNVFDNLGNVVAFLSALALAATMGMNAYGGALSVLTAIDSFRPLKPTRTARIVAILALTVVWYVVGESITGDAVSTVFTALTLMLYLLVPWTATNLIDYFFVRRGHYAITDTELFRSSGLYGVWAWRGFTAYAVGLLFEIPFMVLPALGGWSFAGFMVEKVHGIDIAWMVGLVVSSVTYLVLTRSLDLDAERQAQRESDQELARIDEATAT